MPDLFVIQYESLRQYLASYLHMMRAQPSAYSQRASAREKLTRLTKQQFTELLTDVFDEMNRRQRNSPEMPFLPVKDEYHPKRNQARQKLATLAVQRFKDLACDVYSELERRNPPVISAYLLKFGDNDGTYPASDELQRANLPVQPPTFESRSQNLPKRGISQIPPPNNPPANSNFEHLIADLGNLMDETPRNRTFSTADENLIRSEYETQIKQLKKRIEELESEKFENMNASNENLLAKLEQDYDEQKRLNQELQVELEAINEEYQKLKEDFDVLSDDYNQQQQISNDIRQEATNLLDEIKFLSSENEQLKTMNQELLQKVSELEEQKLEKPIGTPQTVLLERADTIRDDKLETPVSLLNPEILQEYDRSINELLLAAQSDTPTSVLVAMKSVVLSCKRLTEEIENIPVKASPELMNDLRGQLSSSLTELMGVAKKHATSNGRSPISDLEHCARGLTNIVYDLIDACGSKGAAMDIEDLKVSFISYQRYLEDQTDQIVHAIQNLLQTMRSSSNLGADFYDCLNNISSIVDSLVNSTKSTLNIPSANIYQEAGYSILDDLSAANQQLVTFGNQLTHEPTASKSSKQKVASCSYEIAKLVKELISLLDQ